MSDKTNRKGVFLKYFVLAFNAILELEIHVTSQESENLMSILFFLFFF